MTDDSRQAGADIEITPAMLKAGADAIYCECCYCEIGPLREEAEKAASVIFREMLSKVVSPLGKN